jgi:hypothetical protein
MVFADSLHAGDLTVAVTLVDSLGEALSDAQVRIEGTMTHPGMQPVLVDAVESMPGRYEGAMSLSMGGDWILIMEATLPDGRSVRRQKALQGVLAP